MYTNSHTISPDTYQYGVISIPDKYSYKEEQRRRNGYRLRLYWQFKETLHKNKATVFFDTLTYNDECLPHIQDFADFENNFSCFNPMDYKRFVDNLRSRFHNEGIDNRFKVFLTSEFGSSSLYVDHVGRLRRGTKRPHYHLLFFFEKPIDTTKLAWFIYDSWNRGITDSIHLDRKGKPYLRKSTVEYNTFNSKNTDNLRIQKLSNYLSKYVLKDAKFSRTIDLMVYQYVAKLYPNRYGLDKKIFQKDVNSLRSKIAPFIRISHNFGTYFLHQDNLDMDLIYERSCMRLPDKKYVWKYITIPTFYLRKLFYNCVDGQWILNDKGREYMPYHLANRSKRLAHIYQNAYINSDAQHRELIDLLLDGRSFSNLADYVTYYKGRIYNPDFLSQCPDIPSVVSRIVTIPTVLFPSVSIPNFVEYFPMEYRTFWYWNDEVLCFNKERVKVRRKNYLPTDDWHDWIIDDSWFIEHSGFDELLRYFHIILYGKDIVGQKTYDDKNAIQLSIYNNIGIKSDIA